MKLFGNHNDSRTEEGIATLIGWLIMAISAVIGAAVLLLNRWLYSRSLQKPARKNRKALKIPMRVMIWKQWKKSRGAAPKKTGKRSGRHNNRKTEGAA